MKDKDKEKGNGQMGAGIKTGLKEFAEKKGIQKWFKRDNLVILVLCGILLLIIALPTKGEEENRGGEEEGMAGNQGEEAKGAQVQAAGDSEEEYAAYLEKRLEELLGSMDGVGRVRVMITMESSRELVIEKDEASSRSITEERDAEGGSRYISQTELNPVTVYQDGGTQGEPYVIKTLTPRVAGVVILAQGAGTGTVNRSISEAVQALFDLEAHKVKVLKMEKDG